MISADITFSSVLSAKKARLPSPEDFSTGLYTIALGGNDFTYGYTKGKTVLEVRDYLPQVIGNLTAAVKVRNLVQICCSWNLSRGLSHDVSEVYEDRFGASQAHWGALPLKNCGVIFVVELFQSLYDYGGRNFVVWDIEPHGCLPYTLTLIPHTAADLDADGCLIAYNDNAKWFNEQLQIALADLRANLTNVNLSIFNTYKLKSELISANTTTNGMLYLSLPPRDLSFAAVFMTGAPLR